MAPLRCISMSEYLPEKVMVNSEREMVRKNEESPKEERFTSLQPTYEDSVPPEDDWELEQDY